MRPKYEMQKIKPKERKRAGEPAQRNHAKKKKRSKVLVIDVSSDESRVSLLRLKCPLDVVVVDVFIGELEDRVTSLGNRTEKVDALGRKSLSQDYHQEDPPP